MFSNLCVRFIAKATQGIIGPGSLLKSKMPHYAVAVGRTVGIYDSWAECEKQVKGYTGAKFKKFSTTGEAKSFISENGSNTSSSNSGYRKKIDNVVKYCTGSPSKPPKTKRSSRTEIPNTIVSDDEDSDCLDFELNKIMDQVEKTNTVKPGPSKSGQRKTILIDTPPKTSLKRSCEWSGESPTKSKKSNVTFDINDDGFTVVYTDGSCTSNGTKRAKAGLGVYFGENHPLNVSEPVSGRATNNCGEIQAATKAITLAHSVGIKKLAIKTDSQFVINAVTKWLPGWKRKGWKLASGEPVKNEIDFKELDSVLKLMEIKWVYVKAHQGILGNECADHLAKQGAEMYDRS